MKYRYMTLAQCERHRMRKRAWRRLRGKRKAGKPKLSKMDIFIQERVRVVARRLNDEFEHVMLYGWPTDERY